jgi:hypothetical protein
LFSSACDSCFGLVGKEEKSGFFYILSLQENGGGGRGQVQKSPSHLILDGGLRWHIRSMRS